MKQLLKALIIIFSIQFTCASKEPNNNKLKQLFSPPNTWIDQNENFFEFSKLKSSKYFGFVLSYTSCTTLCPMISADLRSLNSKTKSNYDLHFILISIDPKNDRPQILKKYLLKHKLNEKYFTYIKSDDYTTKALAETLRLEFDKTQATGSHIQHSSLLVIYDKNLTKITEINLSEGNIDKWMNTLRKLLK